MFDLGDPATPQITIKDSSGAPADAGAVVCTLTLPDGSTVTPAVVHTNGTGVYSIAYPTVQPGRHQARWVATGANACAFTDVFNVSATDPGYIISLKEARDGMRLPAGSIATDEDIRSLIAAATGPMEDICGPIIPRTCDEWHDGGWSTVRLLDAPVISVTSVSEAYGAGYNRTLAAQDLDGTSFDAFGYTVDLRDGILTRRISGTAGMFIGGRRNVHVVYRAGRTVVPPNLITATQRLVRWLGQTQLQGQRPNGQSPENVTYTPSGFAVPNAVIELCAGEKRVIGIG